jgi:hypothetical protein
MATTPSVRRIALLLLLPAAGLLLGAVRLLPSAEAQKGREPYALIFGTVWSLQGTPVHGVAVKIRPADKRRARWHLMSDRRGEFAQRVPAGKAEYIVWAEPPHHRGQPRPHRPEVKVSIEYDERVDIGLHLKE